jgi:K+/H+ antiporter YhaU regulatory subunit KhtT
MDLRIREQALPGIGHRYELPVDAERTLVVVVQRDGGRQVGVRHGEADEVTVLLDLDHDQAMAVAALLTGARFSIESEPGARAQDVAVETATLSERSPAIGRRVHEVPLVADADAAILAIIRDDTPQLVEDEATEPCRPGDRVVVAARRDRVADVVRQLTG